MSASASDGCMERHRLEGCAGPVRFDTMGDAERPYLVAQIDSRGVTAVPGGRR